MTAQAFHRSVGLKFGPASPTIGVDLLQTISPDPFKGLQRTYGNKDDDGIRVAFDAFRTLGSEPDRCKITLWNLSQAGHDAIVSDYDIRQFSRKAVFVLGLPSLAGIRATALNLINDAHKVALFAGYQNDPKQIFVGDYMTVTTRKRDGLFDFKTELELGDSVLSSRDAYLDSPVGPGQTLGALLGDLVKQAGWATSPDAAVKIAKLTPDSMVQAFTGGALGSVPVPEALDVLGFLTKSVWFVRDGEYFLLGDEDVLEDFGIAIIEGRDILDFSEGKNDGEIQIRTNLNGGLEPGRAIFLFDPTLVPKGVFRCETARYRGDTEGNDWYTEATIKPFTGLPPAFDVSVLA